MSDDTLKPQTELREFVIKRVLGRGSFGVTYLAEDTERANSFAIKEYFPSHMAYREEDGSTVNVTASEDWGIDDFQSGLEKFLEESRTLGGFRSQHIVSVEDTFELNGTAYMVMKYEEGGTLDRFLRSHQEPLTEAQLFTIFMPLLNGLRTIHAKWLLHRDIKPENIYIRKDGTPMLIDFGTARHALSSKQGGMTEFLTPGYAPPEQYDRNGDHGPWTDIYAVGATFYYCVTRIKPYEGRFRTSTNDPVISATKAAPAMYDTGLLKIIDWMMDPDYKTRPQSVEDVYSSLQKIRDGKPSSENSEGLPQSNLDENSVTQTKVPPTQQQTVQNAAHTTKQVKPAGNGDTEVAQNLQLDKTEFQTAQFQENKQEPVLDKIEITQAADRPRRTDPVRDPQSPSKKNALLFAIVGVVALVASIGFWINTNKSSAPVETKSPIVDSPKKEPDKKPDVKIDTVKTDAEIELEAWQAVENKGGIKALENFISEFPDGKYTEQAKSNLKSATEAAKNREIAAAWKKASSTDSSETYQGFLEKYPNSKYADQARSRLKSINDDAKSKETEAAWQTASSTDTVQAYQGFLEKYPDSKYTDQARSEIKAINDDAAARKITAAWKSASSTDTIKAYQGFLEKHPNSKYADQARSKITGINDAAKSRKIAAAWQSASSTDTVQAYQEFLDRYPDSEYQSQAKTKLKNARKVAISRATVVAWQEANSADTVQGYQDFLEKYPDSEYQGQAKNKLKSARKAAKNKEIALAWQKANSTNSIAAYNGFIDKYPDSIFEKLARSKLKSLGKSEPKADPKKVAEEKMIKEWVEISGKNDPLLFAKFIDDYPESIYVKLANIKLANLENSYWLETQKRNTKKAYNQFIKTYPQSSLKKLAEVKRNAL